MIEFMNRRRFLCAALGTAAVGCGVAAWRKPGSRNEFAPGQAADSAARLHQVVRASRALGTEVSITALHADAAVADAAIGAAFAELDLIEEVLSLYRPHSQVCRLNREGIVPQPHPYLVEVLKEACGYSARSDGAFDVTVQPLWSLYAEARKNGRLPEPAEIAAARRKVDWRNIEFGWSPDLELRCGRLGCIAAGETPAPQISTPPEVAADWIRLNGAGIAVTLNGIAQGFATDRALAVLRERGIEQALVNAGELGPLGTKEAGQPWTVGIQHPRRNDAWISLAQLDGRCLATSGDYETTFSPDRAHNHIFDPQTGKSPAEFASVSVVARTGMEADALSTALFVTGLKRGLELILATPGADALFVMKEGRVVQTEGFPAIPA